MPRFTPKRHEQILTQMISKVVARTNLSDVADSGQVKHVLSAAARQDDEQYYQMTLLLQLFSLDTATGEDLDERAKDIQPAAMERIDAAVSSGTVVFSRNVAGAGTVNIQIGTRVKTADGKVFVTTVAGTITPSSVEQISGHGVGRDSLPVAAAAEEPEAAGNVVAETIVKFAGGKPTGVDAVTNPSAFANGLDEETDDAFRNRIRAYISSLARTTVDAIEMGVLSQQDPDTSATVLYSKVFEDLVDRGEVTLYIDDGTGSAESTTAVVGENLTLGIGIQSWQKAIVPIPADDLNDGETFTVDDNDGTVIVFEFDLGGGGVGGGNTAVVYSGGQSADTLGGLIRDAINATALNITASGTFPVLLEHDSGVGSTITISETVVDPDFVAGTITAAVGGESRLFTDYKPVKNSEPLTVTSSTRGALSRDTGGGGDYTFSAPWGQFNFDPVLVQGEIITADYTHYTGLIAYAQKIVDGDPDDRENFPGLRAAGVRVTVETPQVLLQSVNVTVTVEDGYDQDEAKADVLQAIKDYINTMNISDDLIRNELVKRIMGVAGVSDVQVALPAANVVLLDDQLARTSNANIVVS